MPRLLPALLVIFVGFAAHGGDTPPACPPESLAGLSPYEPGSGGADAFASDADRPNVRFERFDGVAAPIGAVRWWGVEAENPGTADCNRDTNAFAIRFFSDVAAAPGTLQLEEAVVATKTVIGTGPGGRTLNEYNAVLSAAHEQASGWLSIVGVDEPDCSFLWYSSPLGDNEHYRQQGSNDPVALAGDLSYCLLPAEPAVEGEGEGSVEGEGAAEGEGVVEGEGVAEGEGEGLPEGIAEGVFEGEGEEEFPPLERCVAGTLGGQRPANVNSPLAGLYMSDEYSDDARFETFGGVAEAIGGLRWWGVGNSPTFSDCNRNTGTLQIQFYEDNAGSVGTLVASFEVTAQRTDTGAVISGRKIYRHVALFPEPVNLAAGWLSIVGLGNEECRFAWYRSDLGDGIHFRLTSTQSNSATGDFSYCLLPVGAVIEEGEGEVGEGEGMPLEGEGALEGEGGDVEGEGVVEGEGNLEGEGILEGEGNLEGEVTLSLADCPAEAMSGQRAAAVDSPDTGVYASDVSVNDQRYERFSGVTAPIHSVRWWGVGLDSVGGFGCERNPNEFVVRFYEGDFFTVGTLVSEQFVTAAQEVTGTLLSNRMVYYHRATLPAPVELADGWISIQGTDDESCRFYWYRSDEGNDEHYRQTTEFSGAGGDFSFCLLPEFERAPGHSADQDADSDIALDELLRVIQLFNGEAHRCAEATEDGFSPGVGATDCAPHASDYAPKDWRISLSELLRTIQLYSIGPFEECIEGESEDGYCAGTV